MLEILLNLYEEGKFKPGGMFEKTAEAIVRNEMEKLANILRYFTSRKGGLNKDLIRMIVDESTNPKEMAEAVSRLRDLSPSEQLLVLQQKTESKSGLLGRMKQRLAANPILAKGLGVGAAVAGLGLASHLAKEREKKETNQAQMTALENVLQNNPDFDRKRSEELFSVLKDVSPTLSSNPVAIEGFIQPHLQWPTLPYTAIKDLAQIEKSIHDTHDKDDGVFTEAFQEVGGALASLLSLGA